ncbi:4Fe-4S ferredoxin iron-sulfur binding domain-containing protein [Runella slithyformis DSM 19594]|uniref:4Fe-4S ferredoxin iron-sulfur binding domain-containing protein n=1 Tax=Runella slithyformis (strain ATCC 29530 / DSM 19594 / LMG 11500 / NCIMB 11436 / LSU 4) TaxID=761193 RepID=A0A7U3ZH90_RUNSL|nr:4Fe-4S ferredoxin iron-sulfur binding domain-containing protein [Runella slithyformis DSM 19594]
MNAYFQHINEGIRTTLAGMKLTLKHLWQARRRRSNHNIRENDYFQEQNGMVTLQYPFETMPIPDNGRYRLHNEMDDCIVCDKCAKVCPVDCIDIEPIKATEEIGKASDGSPIRLYAAVFDIDMAKCCYCGLCTTVCPTECLTMTKTFDYSEFDVRDMNYHYSNLTPESAAEKKALYEQFLLEKEELKKQKAAPQVAETAPEPIAKPKPAFAPKRPAVSAPETAADSLPTVSAGESNEMPVKPKPSFAPKKPLADTPEPTAETSPTADVTPKPKPVFAPKKTASDNIQPDTANPPAVTGTETPPKPKPVFAPKKPVVPNSEVISDNPPASAPDVPATRPKPVFVPKKAVTAPVENQVPIVEKPKDTAAEANLSPAPPARPKPVFTPKKPIADTASAPVESAPEAAQNNVVPRKPKPVFVPKKPAAPSTEGNAPEATAKPQAAETKNIDSGEEKPKPKPIFKPTMRPKKED